MANDELIDAALGAMDADALRQTIREMLPWLDARNHARLINALIERAARGSAGWRPPAPSHADVEEIGRFVERARRAGEAFPVEIDARLRQGTAAFLDRNYVAAFQIFRSLLVPLGNGDIYLGPHELVEDALGVDVAACAAQYVVSMYMTAAPGRRGQAVLAATEDVRGIHRFWAPLQELERAAVEPLPTFEEFLQLPAVDHLVHGRGAHLQLGRDLLCGFRPIVNAKIGSS